MRLFVGLIKINVHGTFAIHNAVATIYATSPVCIHAHPKLPADIKARGGPVNFPKEYTFFHCWRANREFGRARETAGMPL
jgi:hypothetical protein